MKIAVNTRLLQKGKLEGIGWFTYQTVKMMVKKNPQHEFIFLFDRPYDESFIFAPNVKAVVLGPPARHPFLYYLWFDWSVPHLLKKYKADVFLSTDGIAPLHTKVPVCLVIHDLAFEHYPQHLKLADRLFYRKLTPRFLKKAKQIVTVSQFSKQDIIDHYHIPPEKISVAHNGVHDQYRPLTYEEKELVKQKYTDGCEYFFFVGALHPRKNITTLLKAFIVFKRRYKTHMKLVIVGRMAWNYKEIIEMKAEMPYKEDVLWLGYRDVDELSQITGAAYALVYPSLFEGFGIPILEALKCNTPVIVSNTSSMPEVAGKAGLLVDPHSHRDVAEKMGMLYKDEHLRAQLLTHAALQCEKYTWQKAADILWESVQKCVRPEGAKS